MRRREGCRFRPRGVSAIGCVAFWLLTGSIVFERKTPIELALAHLSEPPPNPNDVAPDDIPSALCELVMACLAKDPNHRPQTAAEVAACLSRIAEDHRWEPLTAEAWWATASHPHPP